MTYADQQAPNGESRDASQQNLQGDIAEGSQQNPRGEIPGAVEQALIEEPPKPVADRAVVYGLIAAALGILAGVAFAVFALRSPDRNGPFDLGLVISDADGLKGHLILNWGEKLGYRLVVEPNDPGRRAEFSLAVSSPPRPLSLDLQLKGPAGSVLCTKTIVLKYDPKHAAALAGSDRGPQAVNAKAVNAVFDKKAQAIDIARLEGLELQREHGQDMFQNDIGQDGQIESVSAEGEIPCSKHAYDRTASWSFSPNFPTLDEQAELLKRQANLHPDANAAPTELSAADKAARAASAARKKAKKKVPDNLASFAIEGDDELVGYDPSKGLIETSTRKTFVIDKTSGAFNAAAWEDVPANIHYKCDLKDACTLSRRGATVLYARLMR
jgi:hypothetical protein